MESKEWNPADVFDVFGDSLCRQILVVTSETPLSAATLADELGVSPPTVYRRMDELIDYGLVSERRQLQEDGHHYRVFETAVRRVAFEVDDGGYDVDIQLRQGRTEPFEAFWSDLDDASPDEILGSSGRISSIGTSDDTPL